MAATTTRHPDYNRLPPHLPPGDASLARSFTLAQHFGEAGDILEVCPIGRGDILGAGCAVRISDVDTHATPLHVFSLELFKTGETAKVAIDGSTAGQTGGVARPTKIPATENAIGWPVDSKGWQVRVICDTAAATEAAAGTVEVFVHIMGHRDNQLTE